MNGSFHRVLRSAAAALVVCLCACSDKPPLGRVTGTVKVDGKRVPMGTIVFETKGRRSATGVIVDGQIVEVTSYTTNDGAPVGRNQVSITSTEKKLTSSGVANIGEKAPPQVTLVVASTFVPARYNNPATSELTEEIKSGDNRVEYNLSAK